MQFSSLCIISTRQEPFHQNKSLRSEKKKRTHWSDLNANVLWRFGATLGPRRSRLEQLQGTSAMLNICRVRRREAPATAATSFPEVDTTSAIYRVRLASIISISCFNRPCWSHLQSDGPASDTMDVDCNVSTLHHQCDSWFNEVGQTTRCRVNTKLDISPHANLYEAQKCDISNFQIMDQSSDRCSIAQPFQKQANGRTCKLAQLHHFMVSR